MKRCLGQLEDSSDSQAVIRLNVHSPEPSHANHAAWKTWELHLYIGGAWRAVRADDEPPPRADPTGLRSQTFSMQPNSGAPSHPGRPSNPCVSPTRYGRPLMIQKRNYWRTKDQERQARPAPISYQRQRHTGHEGARPKRNRASPSLMARRAGSTYPMTEPPLLVLLLTHDTQSTARPTPEPPHRIKITPGKKGNVMIAIWNACWAQRAVLNTTPAAHQRTKGLRRPLGELGDRHLATITVSCPLQPGPTKTSDRQASYGTHVSTAPKQGRRLGKCAFHQTASSWLMQTRCLHHRRRDSTAAEDHWVG